MRNITPFNGGIQVPLGIFFFFLTYTSLQGGDWGKALWGPGIKSSLGVVEVVTRNGGNEQSKPRNPFPSALNHNPGNIKLRLLKNTI